MEQERKIPSHQKLSFQWKNIVTHKHMNNKLVELCVFCGVIIHTTEKNKAEDRARECQ